MTNQEFLESISLPGEVWKDVVGFEGYYIVSSFGRVSRLGGVIKTKGVNGKKTIPPSLLAKRTLKCGYESVCLCINSKHYYKLVHRLVAMAFLDNPSNKPAIDHIDGNKKNNNVTNLRWCSYLENMRNPITIERIKTISIGRKCPDRSTPVVRIFNGEIKIYNSIVKTEEDGFCQKNVSRVCRGRAKTHFGYQWMFLSDYEKLNQ